MQIGKVWRAGLFLMAAGAIYGCGGGVSGSSTPVSAFTKSQSCIGCHETGTGAQATSEWKVSVHAIYNAAGCTDCHDQGAKHYCSSCHGGSVPVGGNSHALARCFNCHDNATTIKPLNAKHLPILSATTLAASQTGSAAFNKYSTAGFVVLRGTSYAGKCSWCHNPHNNTVSEEAHREWAESGHGETKAKPWIYYDFKTRGTAGAVPQYSTAADCVRCHTATGYINYVSSGFTDVRPWGVDASGNSIGIGKQVAYCNVCHDSGNNPVDQGIAYGYQRRSVPRITAYYNYSSARTKKIYDPVNKPLNSAKYPRLAQQYPDIAASNICLGCHAGREAGATLHAAFAENLNGASNSFINSHYLTAGGTLFKTTGFEFYTSSRANYYDNYPGDSYRHDKIGRLNYFGTGNDGPCVTCHLKPRRHTFLPITKGANGPSGTPLDAPIISVVSRVCADCHAGGWSVTDLNTKKQEYYEALKALKAFLENKGLYFSNTSPYFFTSAYLTGYAETGLCSSNLPVNNWQSGGTSTFTWNSTRKSCTPAVNLPGSSGTGLFNMGAAFNLNLLYHDYGAYAHNSRYTKRLIYDSIDWLDDNLLNYSVGNALEVQLGPNSDAWNYLKGTGTPGTFGERP